MTQERKPDPDDRVAAQRAPAKPARDDRRFYRAETQDEETRTVFTDWAAI